MVSDEIKFLERELSVLLIAYASHNLLRNVDEIVDTLLGSTHFDLKCFLKAIGHVPTQQDVQQDDFRVVLRCQIACQCDRLYRMLRTIDWYENLFDH